MADAPPQTAEKAKKGFLDCPREIRDKLYDLALAGDAWHFLGAMEFEDNPCFSTTSTTFKALRSTNHQIAAEAFASYFGANPWIIDLGDYNLKICDARGKRNEHCVCDDALSAVRDLEVLGGYSGGFDLSIKIKRKGEDWQVTCKWNHIMAGFTAQEKSAKRAEKEASFAAMVEPAVKDHCARVTEGRDGGLRRTDFEEVQKIVGKAIEETHMQPFKWMRR